VCGFAWARATANCSYLAEIQLTATADYKARKEEQISLTSGETVTNLGVVDGGWLHVQAADGRTGRAPRYVLKQGDTGPKTGAGVDFDKITPG
jgi:hypothetical protein